MVCGISAASELGEKEGGKGYLGSGWAFSGKTSLAGVPEFGDCVQNHLGSSVVP